MAAKRRHRGAMGRALDFVDGFGMGNFTADLRRRYSSLRARNFQQLSWLAVNAGG